MESLASTLDQAGFSLEFEPLRTMQASKPLCLPLLCYRNMHIRILCLPPRAVFCGWSTETCAEGGLDRR